MNIIYGINSDGLGHAVRSIPILKYLKKDGHTLHIVTSKRVKEFVGNKFGNYTVVPKMQFDYDGNKINYWKTFTENLFLSKKNLKHIIKIKRLIKRFKADIIISDLERLSLWSAKLFELPSISISNHETIFRGAIEFDLKNIPDYLKVKSISKILAPKADFYFGLCFYKTEITKKNTLFFDPVFLDKQYNYKVDKKDYILVYNRYMDKQTLKVLKEIKNHKYVVFGSKKNYKKGNIIFKKFGTPDMWKYVANAKAFITNGGHTSMCEAILYKTPVYSIPVKGQFEQITNALYLQKKGFGEKHKNLNKTKLRKFLENLDKYKTNLEKHSFEDPNKFYSKLEEVMNRLVKKKKNKKKSL